MVEFALLRNLWTEAGARDIFEELITHCVRSVYPTARPVRPAPGDDGVDVFVGVFGEEQRVWQAKYFCDGVGDAQRAQIRESFRACVESPNVTNLREWTLCLPQNLSIEEHKWWSGWKRKKEADHDVQISIWMRTDLLPFRNRPVVRDVFDLAFRVPGIPQMTKEALLNECVRRREVCYIDDLPDPEMFREAIFVQKLEMADVHEHRSRRTAFYNFDLIRHIIEQGGDEREKRELQDLLVRVRDLWEQEHAGYHDDNYGRRFVGHVDEKIMEAGERLFTRLFHQPMLKKGALYSLADICEAYWTRTRPRFGEE